MAEPKRNESPKAVAELIVTLKWIGMQSDSGSADAPASHGDRSIRYGYEFGRISRITLA